MAADRYKIIYYKEQQRCYVCVRNENEMLGARLRDRFCWQSQAGRQRVKSDGFHLRTPEEMKQEGETHLLPSQCHNFDFLVRTP